MSLSSPILTSDTEGVKFAKLQRWLRLAVDNAGISYSMSYPLTDIQPGDTEGTKWAKLGAWMKLLAQNISGGGGGGGVTSIVAGSGISVNQATGAVTITNTGRNVLATDANNAGNTTVTPTSPSYDLALTVGGIDRTSILILATAGRAAGDRARLLLTLPATANIVLEVRNATSGGTMLLPAEIFPSQQLTTDGVVLSASLEFEYTGSAWRFVTSNIPA